jgi:hypothetical protein
LTNQSENVINNLDYLTYDLLVLVENVDKLNSFLNDLYQMKEVIEESGDEHYTLMGFKEIRQDTPQTVRAYIKNEIYDKKNFYQKQRFMLKPILDFCDDADVVAFEDFAFNAKGNITMLAEFCGNIKSRLFEQGKGLRFYDPQSIKLYAGKGNAKKPDMFDYYITDESKFDLSYLPAIPVHKKGKNAGERDKNGISPLSDIVDAFFICSLLRTELKMKNGILDDKEERQNIIKRTTKKTKVALLAQPFISQ